MIKKKKKEINTLEQLSLNTQKITKIIYTTNINNNNNKSWLVCLLVHTSYDFLKNFIDLKLKKLCPFNSNVNTVKIGEGGYM